MDIHAFAVRFWDAVARQDEEGLFAFFSPGAQVLWHCSNERFTAAEYVTANCRYPGAWRGEVQRVETLPGGLLTVARVVNAETDDSFHAVSFFQLAGDKIVRLEEYWGDDGHAPAWRTELGIGSPIEYEKN